jgi:hypothetical protein
MLEYALNATETIVPGIFEYSEIERAQSDDCEERDLLSKMHASPPMDEWK